MSQDRAETTATTLRPGAYRMAREGTWFACPGWTLDWKVGAEPEVKRIPAAAWAAAIDSILAGDIVAAGAAGKVQG